MNFTIKLGFANSSAMEIPVVYMDKSINLLSVCNLID